MNDESYDNDDNPYGKFIMHQYTNMEDKYDTSGSRSGFQDIEIPMKECKGQDQDWRATSLKYYCPEFDENHFAHGGFLAQKYSWLRLGIHLCDDRPEAE